MQPALVRADCYYLLAWSIGNRSHSATVMGIIVQLSPLIIIIAILTRIKGKYSYSAETSTAVMKMGLQVEERTMVLIENIDTLWRQK